MNHRVAVLGAGIMGSASAMFLARRGVEVVLYEAAEEPFSGASRWNEGKIHLGFLYAGDPSLRTARRILPGGLAFRPLVEELLSCQLTGITEEDDVFLFHRDSIVSGDRTRAYFDSVLEMVRCHPAATDYFVDLSDSRLRELTRTEVAEIADPAMVTGGFAVPERSISTQWVADQFTGALAAEPRVELRTATRVLGIQLLEGGFSGPFMVRTRGGTDGPYDAIVNASWEGRLGIDATVGLEPRHDWSHRYRVSLFVRTQKPIRATSAVLCVGAFGDIKNYDGRDFYFSWYPTGLLATGEGVNPPLMRTLGSDERDAIVDEIFDRLGDLLPGVYDVRAHAQEIRLEGGWVFASGQGDLNDPSSTLHRRDRLGINRVGSYFSVDTGKYSIAPWLALQVANAVVE